MASIRLKRLLFTLAGIAAIGIGAATATRWLIPAGAMRSAVADEIRAATGLTPVLRGDLSVSLFPFGAVTYQDATFGDSPTGEPALSVERLTARLRLLPLLAGRIEVADVALERPRIAVHIDSDGRSNWAGMIAALTSTLRADRPNLRTFSDIVVNGGTLHLHDAQNMLDETIADLDATVSLPSITRGISVDGRFVWRAEPITASLSLGDLLGALGGTPAALKVRLAGLPLKIGFDGSLSAKPTLKVDGKLTAESPALREAMRWLGRKPLPGGGFGPFALKAQTSIVGSTIGLSPVSIELDGNAAEGVLTLVSEERQVLQGTLAADAIDLTPYISTVKLLTNDERSWSRLPVGLDGLSSIDLDLRLSAAQAKLGNAKLTRTAVAANLREGKLTVTIGESRGFGGVIKGAISLAKISGNADFRTQLQFTDVDLEACAGEVFGMRRIEGKGDLSLLLTGNGPDVLSLTRTLNGEATLIARKGALAGINVEQLLRRLERRPLSGGGEFRTGRTPFDRLDASLKIVNGTATVENLLVEGTTVRIAVAGTTSIPNRELDLTGTAALTAPSPNGQLFELPFVVQGQWDDPIILPDAQALIRRSGAAAPLLDTMRERNVRDAVSKAIHRLTGTRPAAAPPGAEAAPAAAPPQAAPAAAAVAPAAPSAQ